MKQCLKCGKENADDAKRKQVFNKFFSIILAVVICLSLVGCGHRHTMSEEVLLSATCTSEGTARVSCTECEYSYETTIPSNGHAFGNGNVITEATCATEGAKSYTCSICGETKEETIPAQHVFVDDMCTKCEVCRATNIKANTWYVYTKLDILMFQNCLVATAAATRNGVTLKYYAVCKDCHLVDSMPGMAVPETNYAVTRNYICEHCGAVTIIKFEISD